ncbi:hypothetical protein LMG23994_06914 [Cupriavidus pinatubonensis]|uniref:UspA domain-containing protein n=1 Tax=Cupriavidus pinatubonensis TaxID=248026 RepID=A0ABN7ZTM0_9BURK|nr:hypothetical protein LMG23994_06914 [Cupriavidus pinatubonensis]
MDPGRSACGGVRYLKARCHDTAGLDAYQAGRGLGILGGQLSFAADQGSDLIVTGAYGHGRMRELVLGGVTRTLLESMTVPVLLSH